LAVISALQNNASFKLKGKLKAKLKAKKGKPPSKLEMS
jgi:hypothetical protein